MKKNNTLYLNKCKVCGKIPSINIEYETERLKICFKCSCETNENIEITNKCLNMYTTEETVNPMDKELKENQDINKSKDLKNYKLINKYPIITKDGIKNEMFVNEKDKNDYYYNLNLDSDEKHLEKDAIKMSAYDNNYDSLFQYNNGNVSYTYILIDKEAIGKNVFFKTSLGYKWIGFYNKDKQIFSTDTREYDFNYKIPENSTKMCFYCNEGEGCYQMWIK